MKSLKLVLPVFLSFIIIYFVSCDVMDNSKNNEVIDNSKINVTNNQNSDLVGAECPNPNNCSRTNFGLYFNPIGDEDEFDYLSIYKVAVSHTGYDCVNADFWCRYVTSGTNPTGMGAMLPWGPNCSYTRSVCLVKNDGTKWTGSVSWTYPNSYCYITLVYTPEIACDFGGID